MMFIWTQRKYILRTTDSTCELQLFGSNCYLIVCKAYILKTTCLFQWVSFKYLNNYLTGCLWKNKCNEFVFSQTNKHSQFIGLCVLCIKLIDVKFNLLHKWILFYIRVQISTKRSLKLTVFCKHTKYKLLSFERTSSNKGKRLGFVVKRERILIGIGRKVNCRGNGNHRFRYKTVVSHFS